MAESRALTALLNALAKFSHSRAAVAVVTESARACSYYNDDDAVTMQLGDTDTAALTLWFYNFGCLIGFGCNVSVAL